VHLEGDARVDLETEFDIVQFYLPRGGLHAIARDFGARSIEGLRCPPLGAKDPVLSQLAECLLPSFDPEEGLCAPFVDHILLAMQAHVASKYGQMKIPSRTGRESLAPSQVRRAEELMSARLSSSVSLSELAAECGVSVSHFGGAFKATVGVAPHQWRVERRMELAKQLLQSTRLPMAEVALECGFSHRVAFSKAFDRTVGVSPGAWRKTS
jgi:AraC-like DNA-binding protein